MSLSLLQIDLWEMTFELLQNLAVMYTVITLFLQKFTVRALDSRRQKSGVLFFCLLSLIAMLLTIELTPAQGIRLDLRLAVLTLAGVYLRPAGSALVALFTVIFRLLLGGAGWQWWAAGAFVYAPVAFLTARFLSAGWSGLAVSGLANTAVFIGVLVILSLFTNSYDYYSPFVSPANFWRLTFLEFAMIPLSTVILGWGLKNALSFHRSYSDLARQANLDGLTGLGNHRFFQEKLAEIMASAPQQPISVLMLDIDKFKKYNDTYGHQSGDILLHKLASIFCSAVRSGDIIARYGGEEFIIILPDTAAETAVGIAERLRQAVADHRFPTEKGGTGRITVSIGTATFPADAADKNTLIAAADKALYAAKRAGRNQVKKYSENLANNEK